MTDLNRFECPTARGVIFLYPWRKTKVQWLSHPPWRYTPWLPSMTHDALLRGDDTHDGKHKTFRHRLLFGWSSRVLNSLANYESIYIAIILYNRQIDKCCKSCWSTRKRTTSGIKDQNQFSEFVLNHLSTIIMTMVTLNHPSQRDTGLWSFHSFLNSSEMDARGARPNFHSWIISERTIVSSFVLTSSVPIYAVDSYFTFNTNINSR